MSKAKYSYENKNVQCARVYGRNLPVSTKSSIELCNFLRGMALDKAIVALDNVLSFKQAIPFTRFTDGVGHRKGDMASGRYPIKLATHVKELLLSLKFNAENKNLSDSLKIVHICANKASTPFHQGRQKRRVMKRTHIEIVVEEVLSKEKPKENKIVKKETKTKTKESTKEQKDEVKETKETSKVQDDKSSNKDAVVEEKKPVSEVEGVKND